MAEVKKKKEEKETKHKEEKKEQVKEEAKEPDFRISEIFSELLINLFSSPFKYLNYLVKKLYFYGGEKVRSYFRYCYLITVIGVLTSFGFMRIIFALTLFPLTVFYLYVFKNNPILEGELDLTDIELENSYKSLKKLDRNNVKEVVVTKSNIQEEVEEEVIEQKIEEVKEEEKPKAVPKKEIVKERFNPEALEDLFGEDEKEEALAKEINTVNLDELLENPETKQEVEDIEKSVDDCMKSFFNDFNGKYSPEDVLGSQAHREFKSAISNYEYDEEDDI